MSISYVGLDAHSTHCWLYGVDEEGEFIAQKDRVRTCRDDLAKAVEFPGEEVHVHLESLNVARFVKEIIQPHVTDVVVSDPKQNKWIANASSGDDVTEAEKLARLLRLGEYKEVYFTDDKRMDLFRKTTYQYRRLTKKQVSLKQQIHGFLQECGLHKAGRTSLKTREHRKAICERAEDPQIGRIIEQNVRLLEEVLEEQKRARSWMRQLAGEFDICDRIQKVPGGGLITACYWVAIVKNPFRFKKRQQMYSYHKLGLTGKKSNNQPKSTKHLDPSGHGTLKWVIRTMYQGAKRCHAENGIQRFYKRSLSKTGNPTNARLNTMRKLIDILWSMWRYETAYDDSKVI